MCSSCETSQPQRLGWLCGHARWVDCRRPAGTVTGGNGTDTQAGAPAHSLFVEGTSGVVVWLTGAAPHVLPLTKTTTSANPEIVADNAFGRLTIFYLPES